MNDSLNEYLELAVSAAKFVGTRLREATFSEDSFQIDFKGQRDLVTEYDLWSEKEITRRITERYPGHVIFGEESANKLCEERGCEMEEILNKGFVWVVDPIDGTTNFASRIPHYAVSIALCIDGVPAVGVVYEPCKDELFTGVREQGAFLNGRRIRVGEKEHLSDSVVATGFMYDHARYWPLIEEAFLAVLAESRDLRRWGAASLDICYVACGRFDAYFESTVQPWDVAAATVILTEAGGCVQNFRDPLGTPFKLPCFNYACGSSSSYKELIKCIQSA